LVSAYLYKQKITTTTKSEDKFCGSYEHLDCKALKWLLWRRTELYLGKIILRIVCVQNDLE
jgi:hypothetical protein